MVIGARKNLRDFLGLSDGLSLVGLGRIYAKGLERIRIEVVELGGKIGVKVCGYMWLYKYWGSYITFLTFYYRIGTKGLI